MQPFVTGVVVLLLVLWIVRARRKWNAMSPEQRSTELLRREVRDVRREQRRHRYDE